MLHVEERAVELIYIILLQIINIVFTCVWHNDIYYGLENIYSDLLDYYESVSDRIAKNYLCKKISDLLSFSVVYKYRL